MLKMIPIVWNDDAIEPSSHLIGGKAVGLHELQKIHDSVPVWSTLTTEFFQSIIEAHNELQELLTIGNGSQIQSYIRNLSLDEGQYLLLQEVWERISENGRIRIAVRSSAADEDSAKLSFAGQMDSFLEVAAFPDFLKRVLDCWASLYNERAVSYRRQNGIDPWKAKTAVIVQQMVEAEISGVVFTANPINRNPDEMLITAVLGLGEKLVSGQSDSDTHILDRTGQLISSEIVGEKSCLSQTQLQKIRQLAYVAEKAKGAPLDIEFSIAQDKIYLLQARPITCLKTQYQIWDNSNIGESYTGVTTPLTFSFIRQAYFAVYCQFCETIGVPQKAIFKNRHILQNMLGLIQGRVYYNLLNWYKLISLMPGFQYNKGFMEQMMGLHIIKEHKTDLFSQSIWKKYFVHFPRLIKVSCKMILAHFRLPKQIIQFHARFNTIYSKYSGLDYSSMAPSEILSIYRTLEEEVLWKWRSPITNDFEAMIFYGLLKKLTLKWGLDPEGVLQNDLLSGQGGIESSALIEELFSIAQEIGRDENLKSRFLKASPKEALNILEKTPSIPFAAYLEKYGVRCINEMKLESIPLIDDPLFCIASMQNYLRNDASPAKQSPLRKNSEEILMKKLKGARKWIYRWILRNAKKAIKNRENQRFARTQAYSLVRTLFLAIGRQWEEKKIILNTRDIFYLEIGEIWSYIEGTSTCVNLQELIAVRKREFQAYESQNPDDRIETWNEVYFGNPFAQESPENQNGLIKGLGCCSGIVEREVKVVLSPDSSLKLNKEIMVARQTDPGWGILFPSISGLIIEKGSLLSHSAIVAREMGIPTVVGVKNATKIFSDGDRVRLDGGKGTIQFL